MSTPTIADDMVVTFHYVLADATTGETLDDSRARDQPMAYLHGRGMVVPGLEEALAGLAEGSSLTVELPPERAYGTRQGEPMPVPRSAFPEDAELEPGASFGTRTPDGRPMMLWVTKITDEQVWVDPHHPLAGRTLRYAVEVLQVRPATEDEKAHGHPHVAEAPDA